MHRAWSIAFTFALTVSPACAQGLIWSIPPQDGTRVRYEGEYRHVRFKNFDKNDDGSISADERPTLEDAQRSYNCGDESDYAEVLCWQRQIEIRSVGTEVVPVERTVLTEERRITPEGVKFVPVPMTVTEMVKARWIEIKTVTGKKIDTGLDAGPAGAQIYKVLVPEDFKVELPEGEDVAEAVDASSIPVAYVPILKGYKKHGNSPVRPITDPVLQVYPVLSLVAQYRRFERLGGTRDADVPLGPISATPFKGELLVESRTDRSLNTSTVLRSDEVPFGLAGWDVTIIREQKDGTVERSQFQPVSRIQVEMKVVATDTDAISELVIPEGLDEDVPNAP